MKQIISTLNIFLRQEWITVGVYSIATVLFLFIIFQMGNGSPPDSKTEFGRHALLMISMLSVFVGIYIGSGFLRLQQSHLWWIHSGYRSNLIKSLILAAFIYAMIQFYPMIFAGWSWHISLIAPACITLLSAQLVIGNNLPMKFILPASPFILFQLTSFEIGNDSILLLIIIFTVLAIYLNATNNKRINNATLGLMSGNIQQQFKSGHIQLVNNLFADLFRKVNTPILKKSFSIALIQPSNRFGLASAVMALLCLIPMHFIGDGKIETEAFGTMLLGSMILGLFIELKLFARQLKPIAHTFSSNHHQHLKNKILVAAQNQVTTQTILFILLSLMINLFIDGFINPLLMIKMGASFAAIALVFIPIMLCLNWFNINFKLILIVLIYAGVALFLCGWQYHHEISDLLSWPALATIIGLVLIRWGSNYLWKRQSVEQFMRVYG